MDYENVREFEPTSIDLTEGTTEPPPLLTEADLIALVWREKLVVKRLPFCFIFFTGSRDRIIVDHR